jgi:flagellar assembly protein FliH
MAKNVFKYNEIINLEKKVYIDVPESRQAVVETVETVEEYTGPTADDLRREAELFKNSWEKEKSLMIQQAGEAAESVVKNAEEAAFQEIKKARDEAEALVSEARDEAEKVLRDARAEAVRIVREAEENAEKVRSSAEKAGRDSGYKEGYESGSAEVQRLTDKLHIIINTAIEKRNEIIQEAETQIINLVLLISKKVIKVISENQKNVVINNVVQALRKLKGRGEVVIRVNLNDVKMTSDHITDFMKMVENVKAVTVLEDSSVDPGGCIIETDFGQIDARISSQFHEIEAKILELVPIKSKTQDFGD